MKYDFLRRSVFNKTEINIYVSRRRAPHSFTEIERICLRWELPACCDYRALHNFRLISIQYSSEEDKFQINSKKISSLFTLNTMQTNLLLILWLIIHKPINSCVKLNFLSILLNIFTYNTQVLKFSGDIILLYRYIVIPLY